MSKRLDLKEQRFGRLTAIKFDKTAKRSSWLCKCDCGKYKTISISHLRSGHTKSCGCLHLEMSLSKIDKMCEGNRKFTPKNATAHLVWMRTSYSDGDISFEKFLELSQMNCHYCGVPPGNKRNVKKHDPSAAKETVKNADFIYSGLDRVDSKGIHTLDNVVPCCKYCNFAKNNRSLEEFKQWAIKAFNYLGKWK